MLCAQWLCGETKGLKETCLRDWKKAMEEDRTAASQEKARLEELARKDAVIATGMAELEKRHARAKQDLIVVMAKWEGGSRKGLLVSSLQAWRQFLVGEKEAQKKAGVFKELMFQWAEGQTKGLVRSAFAAWKALSQLNSTVNKAVADERKALEELLSGERGRRDEEEALRRQEEENKHMRSQEGVELMVQKWLLGNVKGLAKEVFTCWHKTAMKYSGQRRQKGAAQMAMAKFLEGDRKALMHTTFLSWKANYAEAKQEGWHSSNLENKQREMEAFLNDERQRYESALSEMEKRHARAHNTVEYAVFAWGEGQKRALRTTCMKAWQTHSVNAAQLSRAAQNVKISMLKWVEGNKKGLMTMVWHAWFHCAHAERHERERQEALEGQHRQWQGFLEEKECAWQQSAEDALREHNMKQCTLMVQKFLEGDAKGLLISVVSEWKAYLNQLFEQERQHEAAKASILRWLEGDKRALTQMCWTHWVHYVELEGHHAAARDGQQQMEDIEQRMEDHMKKSKTHLLKYMAQLMGGAQDPAFMVALIHQWLRHSQGEKSAEMQRQLELQLEEQDRIREIQVTQSKEKKLAAFEAMGLTSGRASLMKYFLIWSAEFQKDRQVRMHKIAHSSVLEKMALYTEANLVKGNAKELITSCFQEWVRDAHQNNHDRKIDWHNNELDHFRGLVDQLTQERIALAEQLQVVYHQLDSVTNTLQKELKTKEELANELREANDQMRKASFNNYGHPLDFSAIHDASRPSSPGSEPYQQMRRISSEGSLTGGDARRQRGPSLPLPSANSRQQFRDGNTSSLNLSGSGGVSTKPRRQESPSPAAQSALGRMKSPGGTSVNSPGSCDWDAAIPRMRDQGIFRLGEAPRL